MSSLYDALEVDKSADTAEIRKAYLKLSRVHHPDKGGDPEKFKRINKAYETLSDDGRRQMYDMTGSEEEGGPGGPGGAGGPGEGGFPFGGVPFDLGGLFHMFGGGGRPFGGGGPGGPGGPPQRRGHKAPPKVHEMPISLWDFYHGKRIKINFDRQKFCEGCKGSGAEAYDSCGNCRGSGLMERIIMMGPGMQGVMRGPCDQCGGEGKKVSKTCGSCGGKKFHSEQKELEVIIEPGMLPGETIVFAKECSDTVEYVESGDVHIVLQQADEDGRFQRGGHGKNDLVVQTRIGLKDALLGCKEHMEGHPGHPQGLVVEIPAGVQNGDVLIMSGEGMPVRGVNSRGALHVRVGVVASAVEKGVLAASADTIRGLFEEGGAGGVP